MRVEGSVLLPLKTNPLRSTSSRTYKKPICLDEVLISAVPSPSLRVIRANKAKEIAEDRDQTNRITETIPATKKDVVTVAAHAIKALVTISAGTKISLLTSKSTASTQLFCPSLLIPRAQSLSL